MENLKLKPSDEKTLRLRRICETSFSFDGAQRRLIQEGISVAKSTFVIRDFAPELYKAHCKAPTEQPASGSTRKNGLMGRHNFRFVG